MSQKYVCHVIEFFITERNGTFEVFGMRLYIVVIDAVSLEKI